MKTSGSPIVVMFLLLLSQVCYIQSQPPAGQNADRSAVKCYEDSPERRGEEGCTILASRPMVGPITARAYWHIDRFNSLDDAKKAAGPNGVAAQAHGGVWLMTVENKRGKHHGGRHVAWIGPLILPAAEGYTIEVRSTRLKQGASTPVHTHSGPEVFYVVSGGQCLETVKAGHRLTAGNFFILAADEIHRGRVQGRVMREAVVLVLHDRLRPASYDLPDPPPLVPCK